MKKMVLALMLALAMIISMGTAVSAEEMGFTIAELDYAVDSGLDKINQMCDDILGKIIKPNMNSDQKIKAAYDFLIHQYVHIKLYDPSYKETPRDISLSRRIDYKVLPLTEAEMMSLMFYNQYFYEAAELLVNGEGVCDNFAALFGCLLAKQDIDAIMVGGDYLNRDGSSAAHAWNYVNVDGTWYWYDVDVEGSVFRRGKDKEPLYYLYKKDTEYWRTNHSWDEIEIQEFVASIPTKTPTAAAPLPTTAAALKATPTASKVLINGKDISFEAYNIDGNNYFKLRDLAYSVNGSDKHFDVIFDSAANAINLLSNKAYTVAGGEMAKGDGTAKTAQATTSKILLDGAEIQLTAYNIGGNNYFKLRDIGNAFNFAVDWDGTNNTIQIDTTKPYTES